MRDLRLLIPVLISLRSQISSGSPEKITPRYSRKVKGSPAVLVINERRGRIDPRYSLSVSGVLFNASGMLLLVIAFNWDSGNVYT